MDSNSSEQRRRVEAVMNRAVRHLDEAAGYLNDAARIAPSQSSEFYQATYELNRVIERARAAADRVT